MSPSKTFVRTSVQTLERERVRKREREIGFLMIISFEASQPHWALLYVSFRRTTSRWVSHSLSLSLTPILLCLNVKPTEQSSRHYLLTHFLATSRTGREMWELLGRERLSHVWPVLHGDFPNDSWTKAWLDMSDVSRVFELLIVLFAFFSSSEQESRQCKTTNSKAHLCKNCFNRSK